jgi:AcrR family transcriptional regulator
MARATRRERRRQLADITLDIIAEKGLRRFTTAELAAGASIAEGTIFRHFDSKKEIVEAAISRMEEVLFEGFPPTDPDPLARLGRFFRKRLELVARHPSVAALVFSEQLVHAAGENGAARIMEMRARSRELVIACLREAHQEGLLKEHADPDHLFFVVQGAMASMVAALLEQKPVIVGRPTPEALWETVETLIRR